jgi:hypothetical protein
MSFFPSSFHFILLPSVALNVTLDDDQRATLSAMTPPSFNAGAPGGASGAVM